jgi:DNA gyrase subunit A
MKFEGEDADDRLIGVALCTEDDDILLATRNGRAIRFPVPDVRVFTGRASVGVRGVRLLGDDEVMSMAVLRHAELSPEMREAYLSEAARRRRAAGEETGEAEEAAAPEAEPEAEGEASGAAVTLTEEQFADLAAREQMLLTVTANGFGLRTSAYDYRITARGGQGVFNASTRRGKVVAALLVQPTDEIILVTNGGMVIRTSVKDVRIVRRNKLGVVLFKVGAGERVVSAARLAETGDDNGNGGNGAAAPEAEGGGEGK